MSDVFGIGQAMGSGIKMSEGQFGANAIQNAAQGYNNINPGVAANQGLQNTQQGLLNTALGRIQNGGLNAADLGRLQAIRSSQEQTTKAGQAAAQSNAQQMGAQQGNSGILGQMVAGQQAANTATQQGLGANQQALGESNEMLSQGSGMANNLQNQNLGIQQTNFGNQMALTGAKNTAAGNVANALNNVGTNAQNFTNAVAGAIPRTQGNSAPNWQQQYGGQAPSGGNGSDDWG